MPFRAYSERSRMTCSAEAYQGIVMRRPPGWAPDRSGAREDAGPASSSVVAPGVRHPLGHDRLGDVPYLLVGQPGDPVGGGQQDRRVEPPGHVRAAGGGVLVGRVVQRVDHHPDHVVRAEADPPDLLQRALGERRAGPDAVVAVLLVPSTGHVVAEEDRKSTRLNSSHVEISYAVF